MMRFKINLTAAGDALGDTSTGSISVELREKLWYSVRHCMSVSHNSALRIAISQGEV